MADAGDDSSLVQAFTQIRMQLGDPEVLIYNAALLKQDSINNLTIEDLVQSFKINVAGAVTAIQQVLPAMRQQKRGTILLKGGGLALHADSNYVSLIIGKSAIRSLTLSLAQQLAEAGIHIATVTINGIIKAGIHFDPDMIAQSYLALHQQSSGKFEPEIIYQ